MTLSICEKVTRIQNRLKVTKYVNLESLKSQALLIYLSVTPFSVIFARAMISKYIYVYSGILGTVDCISRSVAHVEYAPKGN
jgi:hypothetical protein